MLVFSDDLTFVTEELTCLYDAICHDKGEYIY